MPKRVGTQRSELICALGGNDSIRARSGGDTVVADRFDAVARDCEAVARK